MIMVKFCFCIHLYRKLLIQYDEKMKDRPLLTFGYALAIEIIKSYNEFLICSCYFIDCCNGYMSIIVSLLLTFSEINSESFLITGIVIC